jgi:hypothetical protein
VVRLKPEFIKKFSDLEKTFSGLIRTDSILPQLENLIETKFDVFTDMKEGQFVRWMLDNRHDELFEDLAKYYPLRFRSRSNKSYRLYGILAVQVPGSVECERGFSVLNEVKDDLRNRLKGVHLEAAMRVALTPMTAKDFNRKYRKTLVKTWLNLRQRQTNERGDKAW